MTTNLRLYDDKLNTHLGTDGKMITSVMYVVSALSQEFI